MAVAQFQFCFALFMKTRRTHVYEWKQAYHDVRLLWLQYIYKYEHDAFQLDLISQ